MARRMVWLPLVFGLAVGGVHADCSKASAPSIPDGKSASEADMGAAQGAVKAYIASANAYLGCLQTALDSSTASKADKTAMNKQYNVAVDEMQGVAGKWKKAITDFKSR